MNRRAGSSGGCRGRIATASAVTPCESTTHDSEFLDDSEFLNNSKFLDDAIRAGDMSSSWLLCCVGVGS
jgi:hypothetical protein